MHILIINHIIIKLPHNYIPMIILIINHIMIKTPPQLYTWTKIFTSHYKYPENSSPLSKNIAHWKTHINWHEPYNLCCSRLTVTYDYLSLSQLIIISVCPSPSSTTDQRRCPQLNIRHPRLQLHVTIVAQDNRPRNFTAYHPQLQPSVTTVARDCNICHTWSPSPMIAIDVTSDHCRP